MNTILLLFQIAEILIKISPELYSAFLAILAAIQATPKTGNATSTAAAKQAVRAILPIVDADTRAQMQKVLDDYEAGAATYALTTDTP
jgi:hypothetical protein